VTDYWAGLNSSQKKKMNVIRGEAEDMAETYGVERMLAILITFADPYPDRKEAERRYKSLFQNILRVELECGLTVFERSQKGRPHYHLVAIGKADDYKTGFDWAAFSRACELRTLKYQGKLTKALEAEYRAATKAYGASANVHLRHLWKVLSPKRMKRYGIGMVTVAPVHSPKGTAIYYAKYLGKDGQKDERDKGHRDYRIWGKRRKIYASHGLVGGNSYKWRMRCRIAAWHMDIPIGKDFTEIAGKRWAYFLGDAIIAIPWEYVKCWLKHPERLDWPEVQDWDWVVEGKAALDRVHTEFIGLHDIKRDREIYVPLQAPQGVVRARGFVLRDAEHPALPGLGVTASYEQH